MYYRLQKFKLLSTLGILDNHRLDSLYNRTFNESKFLLQHKVKNHQRRWNKRISFKRQNHKYDTMQRVGH